METVWPFLQDGLLTYAFQLCSENTTASAGAKIKAIQCLATAAGPEGMVGGQAFDLLSEGKHISSLRN